MVALATPAIVWHRQRFCRLPLAVLYVLTKWMNHLVTRKNNNSCLMPGNAEQFWFYLTPAIANYA
jgi:hypothetical protein